MAAIEYVATGYVAAEYYQTGLSVDWANKIVFVPRIFMVQVQTTPNIVFDLDLNLLRLALKEIEASEDGMPFPDIHLHNPTVLIDGLEYARQILILNGYTFTFEDFQYNVNTFGANSNFANFVNQNQVGIRANNSAGLIESPKIVEIWQAMGLDPDNVALLSGDGTTEKVLVVDGMTVTFTPDSITRV